MYAVLAWNGSPTPGNMMADVVAVLTGETNISNLSGSINLGESEISSTYAAGWEVYDDATGTADEYILRAPMVDDASQYKYVRIRCYTSSSYRYFQYSVMEDWDSGSNTPTNQTTSQARQALRVNIQSYGDRVQATRWGATARHIWFRSEGSSSSTFPSYNLEGMHIVCSELTRTHPCFEIGSGYLPAACSDINFNFDDNYTEYGWRIPRIIDDDGQSDLTNLNCRNSYMALRQTLLSPDSTYDFLATNVAYDSSGTPYYGIEPFYIERYDTVGAPIGNTSVAELWQTHGGTVAGFEDLTLHTLDTPDDIRCFWFHLDQINTGDYPRLMVRSE